MKQVIIIDEIATLQVDYLVTNSLELYFLDLKAADLQLRFRFILAAMAQLKVTFVCLNYQCWRKDFGFSVVHQAHSARADLRFYLVGIDASSTLCQVQSVIQAQTFANESYQQLQAVLYGEQAHFQAQPALVIDTNQLKTKHALKVGQIDPQLMFYLLNKGFSHVGAQLLLVNNFFNLVLVHLDDAARKQRLQTVIERVLGHEN